MSSSIKHKQPFPSHMIGLNRRNRDLVARENPPKIIALANDKVACKKALQEHKIRTPDMIAAVRTSGEVKDLFRLLAEQEHGFVIKPSQGSQGRAVMLFSKAAEGLIYPLHGLPKNKKELQFIIASIISGEYTAGRPVDCALIEERLRPSTSWVMPELPGAPDLRVIVYRGNPVLAMVRLPTIESGGRANLHRGAVGVGIDLQTCTTTFGIWKDRSILFHPDSGVQIEGHEIEGLEECLELASTCSKAVPLGYMGVDLMLDKHKGPCVIEVNARPGLSIQAANRIGLGSIFEATAQKGWYQ